jgi:uncharacterized protein YodC (DUF2158 family)
MPKQLSGLPYPVVSESMNQGMYNSHRYNGNHEPNPSTDSFEQAEHDGKTS